MPHSRSILLWAAAAAVLSAPSAGAANSARSDQALVCKEKAKTGTRFRSKTCHTRADWDKIAEQHKREADEMINRRMIDDRKGN